jgi:hypothetical protein
MGSSMCATQFSEIPQEQMIDLPIQSNLREGLFLIEYIIFLLWSLQRG